MTNGGEEKERRGSWETSDERSSATDDRSVRYLGGLLDHGAPTLRTVVGSDGRLLVGGSRRRIDHGTGMSVVDRWWPMWRVFVSVLNPSAPVG